jgi:hypothetical protein
MNQLNALSNRVEYYGPDHDKDQFADMDNWVQEYRDRRYPQHVVEYRNE